MLLYAGSCLWVVFFLMIRRPPRSTQSRSSAASDVYKRQAGSVGQSLGVRLAGVDHGLELRQGDLAVLDGFFRDVGCVSGVNRFDRRHGGRFDQLAGMRLCVGDA